MTTDSSTGDWTPERIEEARERCERARGDTLDAIEAARVAAREDLPAALAEIERAWGEIERKVEIMANEHETACRIAAENSTLSKRLSHAHDAANALYRAAMAVEAHRSTGPGWSQSIDFRDLLDALRRAIDPTHLEAAALEAARRDGLDARCKELEAEIERLRARPTLTEEQAETLTDMIESVESPASEGWTLPSGQNVIIKAPGGHLSIVHTSSLQRWAGKLREILDAARGETGEPGAGDTVWTGVSVIARPAAAKEVP